MAQISRDVIRYLSSLFKQHDPAFRAQQVLETCAMVLPVAPFRDGSARAMSGDDLVVDCALYFKHVVKPFVVGAKVMEGPSFLSLTGLFFLFII